MLISILILCSLCRADVNVVVGRPLAVAGATYVINQRFEGSGGAPADDGYDNSEVWFEASNPDEDYTTSPAPLEGSQSIFFTTGGGIRAFSPTFTAIPDCSVYFLFRPTTIATGDTPLILRQTSGAALMSIVVNGTGNVRCEDAGITSTYTVDAMAIGTTYHVWVDYVAGTGADAQYSVGFSTTGTKPTSGNSFSSAANGAGTLGVTSIRLSAEGGACAWIFDKVLVDDADIGSNPL